MTDMPTEVESLFLLRRIAAALERISPIPVVVKQPEKLDDDALTIVTPEMRTAWQREDDEADRQKNRPLLT